MGLGRAAVVGQRTELGIDGAARGPHLVAVRVGDAAAAAVPDQAEAGEDWEVWTTVDHVGSRGTAVLRNQAVREPETGNTSCGDAASLLGGRVACDGAAGERDIDATFATNLEDAAADVGRVARDRTVRDRNPGRLANNGGVEDAASPLAG